MSTETDEELIQQAKGLHQAIQMDDCCAAHDLLEFEAVSAELIKRGYQLVEGLEVVKADEEET